MDAALSQILADLRQGELSGTEGAALENMRGVVPRKGCDPRDLVTFLESAAEIRLAQAQNGRILPATFYAWYDEQAGELRFSLVRGRADTLPFGASVDLVSSSSDVVRDALATWSPGFVPFADLTDVEWVKPVAVGNRVRVWARTTEVAV